MPNLEEKVERLVAGLRRYGRGMKLSKDQLDGEITRTLGIWHSGQRAAFRKALEQLGVVVRAGEWYVWGEKARDLLEREPAPREPGPKPGRPKFIAWLADTVRAKGRTTVPELLREALLDGRWGVHTDQLDYYLAALERGGLVRRQGEEVVWSG